MESSSGRGGSLRVERRDHTRVEVGTGVGVEVGVATGVGGGSGVATGVGIGVDVGVGVSVGVGIGVGVGVGVGVGGGVVLTVNSEWPPIVRSTLSKSLRTPLKEYRPSSAGTITV